MFFLFFKVEMIEFDEKRIAITKKNPLLYNFMWRESNKDMPVS